MHDRTITIDAPAPGRARPPGRPGIDVRITESGQGGRALLLLHGFTGHRSDFVDWMDPLAAAGWHVIAPDLRGHGDSTAFGDESAYAFEQFPADVIGLVDALGWRSFVLLGHSFGGMVAQSVAVEAGDRLTGLVLMDTSAGAVPVDEELVALAVGLARDGGMDAVADAVAALGDEDPLATEADRRLKADRPDWAARTDRNLRSCAPAMYAATALSITGRSDRLAELSSVRAPTLVMVGALDELFVEPSRAMAATMPHAELAVIPDAGHSPQVEAPEAWGRALFDFLAGLAAEGSPPG